MGLWEDSCDNSELMLWSRATCFCPDSTLGLRAQDSQDSLLSLGSKYQEAEIRRLLLLHHHPGGASGKEPTSQRREHKGCEFDP